ncbi:MAG: MFS transporter, partial [Marinilabiliales bacterium]
VGKTYLIYGVMFFLFAVLVKVSNMPSFVNDETIEPGLGVLKNRHLSLGILAIFFYVGSEVSVGTWLVEFLKSKEIMGMTEENASYFLSYFWGGLMTGRLMASVSLNDNIGRRRKYVMLLLISLGVFAFIFLVTGIKYTGKEFSIQLLNISDVSIFIIYLAVNYFAFLLGSGKAAKSLVIFSMINAVLLVVAMFSKGSLAMWSIIGTGLFFSIGWSNVFTLAIKDLGKYTSQGSSLLVMAIVGGAVLPRIQSEIIESYSIQASFIIPLIGMAYLMFYGLNGHKIKVKND